jgi:hypothetical protein
MAAPVFGRSSPQSLSATPASRSRSDFKKVECPSARRSFSAARSRSAFRRLYSMACSLAASVFAASSCCCRLRFSCSLENGRGAC